MRQAGRASDQSALASRLSAEFRAPLFSFFLRRVNDAAAAEDLTQDTFVKVVAIANQSEIQAPGALIFRIAGNLLKDRYSKASRRRKANLQDLDMAPVSAVSREFIEDQNPERVLIARERVTAVKRALDELGERTRTIYVLFRLENMQQREIAELFGVSKSTVEKTIIKASVHLMKRLGPRSL